MGKVVAFVLIVSGALSIALVSLVHRATGTPPQIGIYTQADRTVRLLGHELTVSIGVRRATPPGSQTVRLCPFGGAMVLELESDLIPVYKTRDRWGQSDAWQSKCETATDSSTRSGR
jgi:hypothetical protein